MAESTLSEASRAQPDDNTRIYVLTILTLLTAVYETALRALLAALIQLRLLQYYTLSTRLRVIYI